MSSETPTTREQALDLKHNSQRAQWTIYIFYGICALNLIAILSEYLELRLLERAQAGAYISQEEANANDLRQIIIGVVQTLTYLASAVLFLSWFRRAYGNLHRLREYRLQYSENMAIWSFFIPFINVVRPFRIAQEVAFTTKQVVNNELPGYQSALYPPVVGIWWGLFLGSKALGSAAAQLVAKGDSVDQMITSAQVYIVSDSLDIAAAAITILMIKQISKDEEQLHEIANTQAGSFES